MPFKVTVAGSGSMGTACAMVLAEHPDLNVTLWVRDEKTAIPLRESRVNPLLAGITIPDHIAITHDIQVAAADTDFLLVAIPSQFLRVALKNFAGPLPKATRIISVVKGIENETFLRPSQIIQQVLGEHDVVALVGPSHAEEIALRLPCSVVAAADDLALAKQVQAIMSTDRFRVYTKSDLIGAELAGALKNLIGIAAGICDGLGYGDNAKAALITRGMVEITRFAVTLGAQAETFAGLAGLGDLIATCTSQHGRNRKVGEWLGKGQTLAEIQASMNFVAEGISTTRAVHDFAQSMGIELPIIEQVYRVLFQGVTPEEATDVLLRRPTGEE